MALVESMADQGDDPAPTQAASQKVSDETTSSISAGFAHYLGFQELLDHLPQYCKVIWSPLQLLTSPVSQVGGNLYCDAWSVPSSSFGSGTRHPVPEPGLD